MSAFLVEDKTINKVASMAYNYRGDFTYIKSLLAEININSAEELGKAMFDLNVEALKSRYGSADGFRDMNYKYQPEYCYGNIAVFKALQCWNYQCSEGDVPNKPLYKIMEMVENNLARSIVYALPEYDNAAWA